MENLNIQLKALGLGDHEAAVYATLLLSSPASATFIAKKCSLARSSVYTALNSLIAKGLVGTSYRNYIKQFVAQEYSVFEQLLKKEQDLLHEKQKIFKSLKTNLGFLLQSNTQVPQIVFFEEQEGLKKIYLSMMRQAEYGATLYLLRDEFVWQPEWKFIFEQDWHDRVKKIKKEKNIQTKLLINNSAIEKSHLEVYKNKKSLQYKFLRTGQIKQFALYILGDIVSILSIEKNNLVGLKIVNPNFTANFLNIFSALWK